MKLICNHNIKCIVNGVLQGFMSKRNINNEGGQWCYLLVGIQIGGAEGVWAIHTKANTHNHERRNTTPQ